MTGFLHTEKHVSVRFRTAFGRSKDRRCSFCD